MRLSQSYYKRLSVIENHSHHYAFSLNHMMSEAAANCVSLTSILWWLKKILISLIKCCKY